MLSIVDKAGVVELSRTNFLATGESLTTPQLITLIILTVFDVALLVAAITWNRHRRRNEKKKEKTI